MNIKDTLFLLSDKTAAGYLTDASDAAYEILNNYAFCKRMDNLTVIGEIKGNSDYTIMLEAHVDEIAMIVTHIDDKGFVTVAKAGGIDIRTLPAKQVTIHSGEKIPAVFSSTPPHLASGDVKYDDISKIKLDTGLGTLAKEKINPGDLVTFCAKPIELLNNRFAGKSFDNRAGVTCLLEVARRIYNKELPCNVLFVLSDQEELGMRGAKTAAFSVNTNEAIVIDVSFGDGIDISPLECGKLSEGGMIGFSPILEKKISKKLVSLANQNNIKFQNEIMAGKTGTNSDVISVSKSGVKTGMVSIPLRNMHSDVEVIDLSDLESVCDLLEKYILSGGISND